MAGDRAERPGTNEAADGYVASGLLCFAQGWVRKALWEDMGLAMGQWRVVTSASRAFSRERFCGPSASFVLLAMTHGSSSK